MDIILKAKKLLLSAFGYSTTVETTATRVLFETDAGYFAFNKSVQGTDPVNDDDFVTKKYLESEQTTVIVQEIDITVLDAEYVLLDAEPNMLFVPTNCYVVCTEVDDYTGIGVISFNNLIGTASTIYSTANFSEVAQIMSITDETYSGTNALILSSALTVKIKLASVSTSHKAKVILIGKKISY